MSKYFGKFFGPSSFLLSKFAWELKLIQSVVRFGILGICVTSSILRVLLSGFWVSGWVTISKYQGSFSRVLDVRAPEFWVSGSRISGSQVSGSWGLRSQGPRSRVSGPDFRLCLKQPVYFLKTVEFWLTFDIHVDITLAIFQEKLQNHTF